MTKEWAKKKKSVMRRSDSEFTNFIRTEFPGVSDPERERRIMDELINGKKKKR